MIVKTSKPYVDDAKIIKKISSFWNKVSFGWKNIWGDHIHHGFYDSVHYNGENGEQKNCSKIKKAEELLIDKILEQLKIKPQLKILDVGCGLGGTSIYLSKHIKADVTGISISHEQIELAKKQALHDITLQIDVKDKKTVFPHFMLDDAHRLRNFSDQSFDLVWSLESAEQFYDKNCFIEQAYRVLKPGGQIMIATWCSNQEQYEGNDAILYQKLCKAFLVPYMPTINHYENLLKNQFTEVKSLDWSENVKSSWARGINHIKKHSLWQLLRLGGLKAGIEGFVFMKNLKLMDHAFSSGQLRYGVFVAKKGPTHAFSQQKEV